jgi:hypothetical protein
MNPPSAPCGSVRSSSPALDVAPSAVVAPLVAIEDLPEGSTGALVFREGAIDRGAVFIEGGRVCWAVALHMRRRLTDLLRHQTEPPLEPTVVERVYRQCRVDSRPLGEALVESGIVSECGLRCALRQHNAEAIALLGSTRGVREWRAHRNRRYDAKFTFSTAELLVSVGALQDDEKASTARGRLRGVLDEASVGVAFARTGGAAPVPVGIVRSERLSVGDVMQLGEWLTGTLDLAGTVDPARGLVATALTDGRAALAWVEGELAYVALCPDRAALARAITRATRPGSP